MKNKLQKTQPVNCRTNVHPLILGLARIFDFTQIINQPGIKDEISVDTQALREDWEALGADMEASMRIVMQA